MDTINGVTGLSGNFINDVVNSIQTMNLTEQNLINPETDGNNNDKQEPNEQEIKKITRKLNNIAASLNFDLDFKIHKETGKIFVKVIDKDTHKIIKEIPPKSMLDFLSKFEEAVGALFDKKS